jgi:hypothetical protein
VGCPGGVVGTVAVHDDLGGPSRYPIEHLQLDPSQRERRREEGVAFGEDRFGTDVE